MPLYRMRNTLGTQGVQAFLNVEAGVTRGTPPDPEQQVENLRRRLTEKDRELKAARRQLEAVTAKTPGKGAGIKNPPSDQNAAENPTVTNSGSLQSNAPPWLTATFIDRREAFRSILAHMKPGKLLDLGSGHGKFAERAQELGWQVTAVDARSERFPDTPGIEWVTSDVRDFEFGLGDYDCVSVLGLLYHLDLPAQLQLLKKCAGTFTLIDTHVALNAEVTEGGYEGSYYVEAGEKRTDEELRAATSAAWGNRQSFWPTEGSLLKMVRDSGFSFVAPVRPPWQKDRTLYMCYP